MSRPTRARGLKLTEIFGFPCRSVVAPYAGAWIETAAIASHCAWVIRVAPYAGAWIETTIDVPCPNPFQGVAPYAGAWIET